jgi:hypothetical protein
VIHNQDLISDKAWLNKSRENERLSLYLAHFISQDISRAAITK